MSNIEKNISKIIGIQFSVLSPEEIEEKLEEFAPNMQSN